MLEAAGGVHGNHEELLLQAVGSGAGGDYGHAAPALLPWLSPTIVPGFSYATGAAWGSSGYSGSSRLCHSRCRGRGWCLGCWGPCRQSWGLSARREEEARAGCEWIREGLFAVSQIWAHGKPLSCAQIWNTWQTDPLPCVRRGTWQTWNICPVCCL